MHTKKCSKKEQAMNKLIEIFCDVDGALGKAVLFLRVKVLS
ncbi:hypothetical protein [Xenorhabdus lircayensis]|nr:hypothetical protein [Xenorhabdus lircayensis]